MSIRKVVFTGVEDNIFAAKRIEKTNDRLFVEIPSGGYVLYKNEDGLYEMLDSHSNLLGTKKKLFKRNPVVAYEMTYVSKAKIEELFGGNTSTKGTSYKVRYSGSYSYNVYKPVKFVKNVIDVIGEYKEYDVEDVRNYIKKYVDEIIRCKISELCGNKNSDVNGMDGDAFNKECISDDMIEKLNDKEFGISIELLNLEIKPEKIIEEIDRKKELDRRIKE